MTFTTLVARVTLTILLIALGVEAASLIGDLMSAPSDLAVVVGAVLAALTVMYGAKALHSIWRKR